MSLADVAPDDPWRTFAAECAAYLRDSAAASADSLRRQFDALREARTIEAGLVRDIARIVAEARYKPEHAAAGQIVLHDDAQGLLALRRYGPALPAPDDLIYSDAQSRLLFPLIPGDVLQIAAYRADASVRPDVFDANAPLVRVDVAASHNPVVLRCDGSGLSAHEVRCDVNTLVLEFVCKRAARFIWGFDRNTLGAKIYYPNDVNAARSALLLDYLLAAEHPRTEALAGHLRAHPAHFLRWKATQVLARCFPQRAPELLESALLDEHPDIRATAERALAARRTVES